MKLFFTPTKEYVSLSEGISLLADDLGIELSDNSAANVTLTVSEAPEAKLHVVLDGKNACITYGGGKARFFRALAILIKWLKDGKTAQTLTETPLFISLPSGVFPHTQTGNSLGQVHPVVNSRNFSFTVLSSREWNVIIESLPPTLRQ